MIQKEIIGICNRLNIAWGNPQAIKSTEKHFLKKYYLPTNEYLQDWKIIQQQMFHRHGESLPDRMFNRTYKFFFVLGGLLFEENDYRILQDCLMASKDTAFVVIENFPNEEPGYKFKFPTNLSFDQLHSGGLVSHDVFGRPIRDYFVYGNSGNWGRYMSDYFNLDIYGVKEPYFQEFKENFYETGEMLEGEELINYLSKFVRKADLEKFKQNYLSESPSKSPDVDQTDKRIT